MNDRQFQLEANAYGALQELLEQARATAELFERAGVAVPPPLARMFGLSETNGAEDPARPRFSLSPLEPPWEPEHVEPDWIWLPVGDLQVTSLALGILRNAGGPMRPKDIGAKILQYRPEISSGSVYNVGPRLDGTVIRRSDDGWALIDPSSAPMLNLDRGCAWGPIRIFGSQEAAAHRRMVMLHILRAMSDGLMAMQLVKELGASGLCKAKANKDLIKADLLELKAAGKVRRVGNTRKWTIDDRHGG